MIAYICRLSGITYGSAPRDGRSYRCQGRSDYRGVRLTQQSRPNYEGGSLDVSYLTFLAGGLNRD
jgi:hypothetical protein